MLWTHPVIVHTTPNAKRRGNVNSDTARHGTVCPDADRPSICLPDGAWQSIFLLDALCHGIFLLDTAVAGYFPSARSRVRAFSFCTQPCQGIFLLDAAVPGHFPSARSRVRAFSYWTRPDDACHGTTFTLAVKARNITANTWVVFANTQRVPGIVTQSSSILYIYGMYIYICYYHTSRFQHKHPASHPSPRSSHVVMLF